MNKKIKIDAKHSVELDSSAGWLLIYRNQFGKDILPMIEALVYAIAGMQLSEDGNKVEAVDLDTVMEMFVPLSGMEVTTILQCLWAMAKNADDNIDPPFEWINQFPKMPIDTVTQEVLNIIGESMMSAKNWKRLKDLEKIVAGLRQTKSSSEQ